MSTNILCNSPALHSLKRAQLVQLCKRHNIKASGKNTELVARLKRHAHTFPATADPGGAETEVETETEGEREGADDVQHQHPSEMWEVVMDDIPEEENAVSRSLRSSASSRSTLASTGGQAGEFGASGSSKPTVMQALASSLGLKRSTSSNSNNFATASESGDTLASLKHSTQNSSAGSRKAFSALFRSGGGSSDAAQDDARDSLIANAIPYNNIPARRSPFAFPVADAGDMSIDSLNRPVPGVGPRVGVEASHSNGTVRLITNTRTSEQLQETPDLSPCSPAFDLVPPTPGNDAALNAWPLSPHVPGGERLYPILNFEDVNMEETEDAVLGGRSLTLKCTPANASAGAGAESSPSPSARVGPFVFGSPQPRHSTSASDFTSAASNVLAEMNARLGVVGGKALTADVLARAPRAKLSEDELLSYQFGGRRDDAGSGSARARGEGSTSSRFDRTHERVFSRMDGIDTHYAARRGLPLPQDSLVPLSDNRKRKSSALELDRGVGAPANKPGISTARVISAGAKRRVSGMGLPGAFGDDGDEEPGEEAEVEEELERETKRACVTRPADDGSGDMRVSIAPAVRNAKHEVGEDAQKTRKQNEAIKRRLEYNKAHRRSSRGCTPLSAQKQKSSRFAFLASAKSLVKAVWNRGAGNPSTSKDKDNVKPVKFKPSPSPAPVAKEPTGTNSKPILGVAARPTVTSAARASNVRSASANSNGLRPKPSTAGHARVVSDSVVGSNATTDAAHGQRQDHGPILGSTRPRKASTKSTLAGSMDARSRLTAPTASSLAKTRPLSPTKPTSRARASVPVLSPSRIPVFSQPAQVRLNNSMAPGGASPNKRSVSGPGTGIFSSPLVIMTSTQVRSTAEKGHKVNPITGAVTPVARRAPFTVGGANAKAGPPSLIGMAASIAKTKGSEESKEQEGVEQEQEPPKLLSGVQRKPRVSRSKVIARLGAQRERIANSAGPRTPVVSRPGARNVGGTTGKLASPKFRTRSSAGSAVRRSIGGAKVREGAAAGGIMMSAKKRARASECARRRSAKAPMGAPSFGEGEHMDLDD